MPYASSRRKDLDKFKVRLVSSQSFVPNFFSTGDTITQVPYATARVPRSWPVVPNFTTGDR